jgi:hypothetical protein
MTEQSEQYEHPSSDLAQPYAGDQPATVADLVGQRLEESPLSEHVKALLREALGEGETREASSAGRIYLAAADRSGNCMTRSTTPTSSGRSRRSPCSVTP